MTPTAPAERRLGPSPSPEDSFFLLGRVLVNREPATGLILFGVLAPDRDPGRDEGRVGVPIEIALESGVTSCNLAKI